VVTSDDLSVEQISSTLGSPPDYSLEKGAIRDGAVVRKPALKTSWKMREEGSGTVSLSDALGRLFERVAGIRENLVEAGNIGCVIMISVVQYVSEQSDLGFSVSADNLQLLADIGAFIDVDQYID